MDVAEEIQPQPMVVEQVRVPPGPPATSLPYREDRAVHNPDNLADQMMEVLLQHPKSATNSFESMLQPGDDYNPSMRGSYMQWNVAQWGAPPHLSSRLKRLVRHVFVQ